MLEIILAAASASLVTCSEPYAIDGDMIVCGSESVRLAVIDAPELPGRCRTDRASVAGDGNASKAALAKLLTLGRVAMRRCGIDRYGRTLVHVYAPGRNLGAVMVQGGAAVERYLDRCL